ncbi:hypothetical protein BGZ61DRAFT_213997 [Ilyonectria robusta]|uniref:uncharacterized protein n=1 Tax=Ilyonectria robusta TaxID=1079257 RepID=UPI001E8D3377|nr:uncharacterized protein BGZ61DRAFT_213997 [Ilyonectria robusta]KAH8714765.1 hypothetical protein BGZ61DRAFT_213997 [Ilyonectria robusta]
MTLLGSSQLVINRAGLTCVFPGPGVLDTDTQPSQPTVNVIFVHGLRGHPRHTWECSDENASVGQQRKRFSFWRFPRGTNAEASPAVENDPQETSSSRGAFWPSEKLPHEAPLARVWTYGYDADVIAFFRGHDKNSVTDHGRDLMVKVERGLKNKDPIIFVAHSLGGLVVKRAMRQMQTSLHYKYTECHRRIQAVVFCGTPHRGSTMVGWGKIAANLAKVALMDSNSKLLNNLKVDAEILDVIQEDFLKLLDEFPIKIHSFLEGCSMTGLKGFSSKVVDDYSAKLGWSKEIVESINADHRAMVKTKGVEDISVTIGDLVRDVQASYGSAKLEDCRAIVSTTSRDSEYNRKIEQITETCILNSLKFDTINDRYRGIEIAHKSTIDAHKSTFGWIFDRPGPGFVDWLESANGIFWVNGKAGSGKSTLMRFIADDARLSRHLNSAGAVKRVTLQASFYFWAAGSPEQRSLNGLLRTILYRILAHAKALLPIVCSKQWSSLSSIAFGMLGSARIDQREKRTKDLERLGQQESEERQIQFAHEKATALVIHEISQEECLQWSRNDLLRLYHATLEEFPSTTTLFLLLDGLDEYEATEEELENLVELLKRTSQRSNLKICLSTRPWTIFENHFGKGQCPSLQLQNFTYDDIRLFVVDSFDRSHLMQTMTQANMDRMPDFYLTIVRKAEGVFLWVRLVVKSLIRGLRNGDELSDLQRKLDELPRDLERLYRHMFDRVGIEYWERSSKIFAIINAAQEPPSALTIWYSGDSESNPLEDISEETRLARCYQVHLRLMSQCAGLLELRSSDFGANIVEGLEEEAARCDLLQPYELWPHSARQHYLQSTVHYLHRTTKDFLRTDEITSIIRNRINGSVQGRSFDPHRWLAIHTLVGLRRVMATCPYYEDVELFYCDDDELPFDFDAHRVARISRIFNFHATSCSDTERVARLTKIKDAMLQRRGLRDPGGVPKITGSVSLSSGINVESGAGLPEGRLNQPLVSDSIKRGTDFLLVSGGSSSLVPRKPELGFEDELKSLLREEGVRFDRRQPLKRQHIKSDWSYPCPPIESVEFSARRSSQYIERDTNQI